MACHLLRRRAVGGVEDAGDGLLEGLRDASLAVPPGQAGCSLEVKPGVHHSVSMWRDGLCILFRQACSSIPRIIRAVSTAHPGQH